MHSRLAKTKRLASAAILITVAFVLSWLEMIVSLPMVVPGVKLGLANIAIVFALYYCGGVDALFVLMGRLMLSAVLFGNVTSLIMSASGAVLSFLVMLLCKSLFGRHLIYVSICGGIAHNIGQLIAASLLVRTSYIWLVPYLIIGGILAGAFNGFVTDRLLRCRLFRRPVKPSSSEPAVECTDDKNES